MGRACNLLIADDDFDQVILIESLLQTLGTPHACHHTPNGFLALRFLRRWPPYQNAPRPHVILLEFDLPGRNGYEVLRRIKSDPGLRSIPVIIVSSSGNRDDVTACYEQHANAVIKKAGTLDTAAQVVASINQFWLNAAELPTDCSSSIGYDIAELQETSSGK